LLLDSPCADVGIKPTTKAYLLVNFEKKVVTAYDSAIEVWRHDPEAAYFRVDLCDHQVARASDLLLFGLDVASRDLIAEQDAHPMKLYTEPLVANGIVNRDELLASPQKAVKLSDWVSHAGLS
jgi:hypothetical protein